MSTPPVALLDDGMIDEEETQWLAASLGSGRWTKPRGASRRRA